MNSTFDLTGEATCDLILTQAFPFYYVVDNHNNILSCGESIQRVMPLTIDGTENLFDHYSVQHPAGVTTLDELKLCKNTFFLLKSVVNPKLLLRGQLVFSKEAELNFLLVAPWVTELKVLDELGLNVNDFSLHSPLSDFMNLLQAQKTSLAESKRLSADLSKLNKELEDRVIRRTLALENNAQKLEESKRNLEHEMNERARVEIELRHAQKLESVGQLAAGIAHEINTPMQYIGNSLQFIKSALSDFDELSVISEELLNQKSNRLDKQLSILEKTIEEKDLAYIRDRAPKALDRALEGIAAVTKIVGALNEFTHPDCEEKSEADINKALETSVIVARNEYRYVAELVQEFQSLPLVECHIGDLNQVFLNLIVNAAHAIADSAASEGKITIGTWAETDFVNITIADTGSGIPENIRHRVFDPFFTTKEVGRGTGQGLAITHNIIVNKHGGSIDYESEVGKGTTFKIRLPISAIDSGYKLSYAVVGKGIAA